MWNQWMAVPEFTNLCIVVLENLRLVLEKSLNLIGIACMNPEAPHLDWGTSNEYPQTLFAEK